MSGEYYQSSFSGAQIDNAIGRIISGELDQLAENAANSANEAKEARDAVVLDEQKLAEAVEDAEAAALTYPKIENGTWWVWDVTKGSYVDTGVAATGPQGDAFEYEDFTEEQLAALKGDKGDPGTTPRIGDNGNWFVGETDTGVAATGPKGDPFTYEDFTEEQLEAIKEGIQGVGAFTAVYGTTTFSEIKAAYDSGAAVLCTRSDNTVKYILTGLTDTTAYFMGMGASANILYRVYVDSSWHAASFTGASQSSVSAMTADDIAVSEETAAAIGVGAGASVDEALIFLNDKMASANAVLTTEIHNISVDWTPPSNMVGSNVDVLLFGGGGGGYLSTASNYGGGGGGGGYMARATVDISDVTGSIPITIGTGGAAGKAGGTSSFGTYLSAAGGSGATSKKGAAGGTGGGGSGAYASSDPGGGGAGDYGGGGGAGGTAYGSPASGGKGGTYGGGGGGSADRDGNTSSGGAGGTYGGAGGKGGSNGTAGTDTSANTALDFTGTGAGGYGSISSSNGSYSGGGGGGGYGGVGGSGGQGYGTTSSAYTGGGGGGGGGYGGTGGNGNYGSGSSASYLYCTGGGGGGGGYGGAGGAGGQGYGSADAYASGGGGGGGGYGTSGTGGRGGSTSSGSAVSGKDGGCAAGGGGSTSNGSSVSAGVGGDGICILRYYTLGVAAN